MGGRSGRGAERYLDELIRQAIVQRRSVCVDSSVLIAYIANEEPIASLAARAVENAALPIVVSTIAFSEIVVRVARDRHLQRITAVQAAFAAKSNIHLVDFDQRHAIETALVRGTTKLKLPDAAIVATARLGGASALLGNDRQWRNKPLGVPYHHMDDILALA